MNCRLTTAFVPLLAGLLLLSALPVTAAPEGPEVVGTTLSVPAVPGKLVSLDATQAVVRPEGGSDRTMPLGELVSIQLPAREGPKDEATLRFRFRLVGGELLVAHLVGAKEDVLTLESASLGRMTVLLDQVRTVEAYPADAGPCHDLLSGHEAKAEEDVAYDRGDDEYHGAVLESTAKEIVIEGRRGRERRLAWANLAVMHLQTTPLERAKGLQPEVELQDGSLLTTAGPVRFEDGVFQFALRSVPKQPLRASPRTVRAVRWSGDAFVYASQVPFDSKRLPYYGEPESVGIRKYEDSWLGARVDRRPSGCPLRMGGRTFRHGFGVYSRSLITLELQGNFTSFRTWLGIDDEATTGGSARGGQGDVDARVIADGKVLWEAKGVTGGKPPRQVGPLDVKGVKKLVLEVGFGKPDKLFIRDRADWGDPILVRK